MISPRPSWPRLRSCACRRRALARSSSRPRSEESSIQSGADSSWLQALTTFGQSLLATLPLRSRSLEIRDCEPMKRCASSISDISREKRATGFLCFIATFWAKSQTSVDFPIAGLAEVIGLLLVRNLEKQALRVLDQRARFAVTLRDRLLDLLGGALQPPHQRVLLDDLRVVLGAARRRDLGGEAGDDGAPADLVELAVLGESLGDRQHVHRIGFLVEPDDRVVDRPVAVAVEVLRLEPDVEQDGLDRRLGDHHGPENRLLGLQVLGRDDRRLSVACQLLLFCAGDHPARRPGLLSKSGYGPGGFPCAPSGTKSARARLENHRPLLPAGELRLFAAPVFQARSCLARNRRLCGSVEINEWSLGLRLGTLSHLGDDRLDRGGRPAANLDLDHVGAGLANRILEADLLAIDLDPARGLDRVGDLGRGDRAEELAVLPGAVVDRQNRLAKQRGRFASTLRGLALGLLGPLALALRLLECPLGCGLRELARHEVVAEIAGGDVDRGPRLAEALHVLEQNSLGHRLSARRRRAAERARGLVSPPGRAAADASSRDR